MGSKGRCPRHGPGPGVAHIRPASQWEAVFGAKARWLQAPAAIAAALLGRKLQSQPSWRLRAVRPRTARATHRGALGQVVATQSVVQVEADHIAGGQGEVLSHGCAGNTGKHLFAGRVQGALEWDGTRLRRTRQGRGWAGLRLPGGRAAASGTSPSHEHRLWPRFSPPRRLETSLRPFAAWLQADPGRLAPALLSTLASPEEM